MPCLPVLPCFLQPVASLQCKGALSRPGVSLRLPPEIGHAVSASEHCNFPVLKSILLALRHLQPVVFGWAHARRTLVEIHAQTPSSALPFASAAGGYE